MHDDPDESAAGMNTRRDFLRTAAVGAGTLLLPLGAQAGWQASPVAQTLSASLHALKPVLPDAVARQLR